MRRYLYIFVIIAVIVLAVLVVLFLRNRADSPANPDTGITPGGLPGVGTQSNPSTPGGTNVDSSNGTTPSYVGQKFGVVAQNQVLGYHVDPQNNVVLIQPDGQIVKVSNGNAVTLSSSVIAGLVSAAFSYDGNKILAVFGDPAKPQASVFDVATKSWQPLAQTFSSAAWSPTNYQIAYLAIGSGVKTLTTLDLSNAKAKPVTLIALHAEDLSLLWLGVNQIIVSEKGSALLNSSIWSFDVKKKILQGLVTDAKGLDSTWNSAVEAGLVFMAGESRRGGTLTTIDAAGNTINNLSFLTLPEKCAFDAEPQVATAAQAPTTGTTASSTKTVTAPVVQTVKKSLYCAIPRDNQKMSASALPDDYQTKSFFTEDNFYKIDLADGNIISLFEDQNQALDATNLKAANQTLFFVNRVDQKLYAISLK